jgi:hypothetical protein
MSVARVWDEWWVWIWIEMGIGMWIEMGIGSMAYWFPVFLKNFVRGVRF